MATLPDLMNGWQAGAPPSAMLAMRTHHAVQRFACLACLQQVVLHSSGAHELSACRVLCTFHLLKASVTKEFCRHFGKAHLVYAHLVILPGTQENKEHLVSVLGAAPKGLPKQFAVVIHSSKRWPSCYSQAPMGFFALRAGWPTARWQRGARWDT